MSPPRETPRCTRRELLPRTCRGVSSLIFKLPELARIDAGRGYSTAEGPVVEGERMQIGLIKKQKGTGARV